MRDVYEATSWRSSSTELGESVLEPISALLRRASEHGTDIADARRHYEDEQADGEVEAANSAVKRTPRVTDPLLDASGQGGHG